jgi:multiple sugar transport system permease protein
MSTYWKANQRRLAPWLFLAPGLLMFAVYVIIPIFQSLLLSLYDWNGLYGPDGSFSGIYIGLDNYREMSGDPNMVTSFWNNLIWLGLYLLAVPAGLLIAIFLNQTVTGIRLYKSLFFFPFVISQVVVGLIFSWFYAPNFGLLYQIIEYFTGTGIAVLADPDLVTYGIIAAGLWPQIAYVMILYLTGLNNVSPDQVEAARLDGAKGWRMLYYVILPQLRPATFIAVVVTVIGALRSFDLVSIMTSGGPFGSSRVLSYYMYETALSEYGYRMGYGAAIAVVLFAIMMIFISGFIWKMWRDETER